MRKIKVIILIIFISIVYGCGSNKKIIKEYTYIHDTIIQIKVEEKIKTDTITIEKIQQLKDTVISVVRVPYAVGTIRVKQNKLIHEIKQVDTVIQSPITIKTTKKIEEKTSAQRPNYFFFAAFMAVVITLIAILNKIGR